MLDIQAPQVIQTGNLLKICYLIDRRVETLDHTDHPFHPLLAMVVLSRGHQCTRTSMAMPPNRRWLAALRPTRSTWIVSPGWE